MSVPPAIWNRHLKTGERIVWSAAVSPAIRRAQRTRERVTAALLGFGATGLAGLFLYRFYAAVVYGEGQANLPAIAAAPLFLALAVALGAIAFWLFRKLRQARAAAAGYYAITSKRLLAVSANGDLIEELDASQIAGAFFDNDSRPSALHIARRNDDSAFFIEHIEDLPAVRARIREAFPEAPQ